MFNVIKHKNNHSMKGIIKSRYDFDNMILVVIHLVNII